MRMSSAPALAPATSPAPPFRSASVLPASVKPRPMAWKSTPILKLPLMRAAASTAMPLAPVRLAPTMAPSPSTSSPTRPMPGPAMPAFRPFCAVILNVPVPVLRSSITSRSANGPRRTVTRLELVSPAVVRDAVSMPSMICCSVAAPVSATLNEAPLRRLTCRLAWALARSAMPPPALRSTTAVAAVKGAGTDWSPSPRFRRVDHWPSTWSRLML